jgi:hypothetical protein
MQMQMQTLRTLDDSSGSGGGGGSGGVLLANGGRVQGQLAIRTGRDSMEDDGGGGSGSPADADDVIDLDVMLMDGEMDVDGTIGGKQKR